MQILCTIGVYDEGQFDRFTPPGNDRLYPVHEFLGLGTQWDMYLGMTEDTKWGIQLYEDNDGNMFDLLTNTPVKGINDMHATARRLNDRMM